jgi:hypothetical protein
VGENADHPLASPQMMSGKMRPGDQFGWLLHTAARYAPSRAIFMRHTERPGTDSLQTDSCKQKS